MTDIPWTTQQQAVLQRLQDVLDANRRQGVPRLVRVEGGTRTGKSAVLMEIAARVRSHYDDDPGAVLIVATTNAAAAAVGGRTFHSAFALPGPNAGQGPLGELRALRAQDRQRLRAVRVVLIDECSMVPADLLDRADRRLRTAVGENGSPFGGRAVFAFGDFASLGPIRRGQASAPSRRVWAAFTTVQTLDQTHMAESTFRRALQRLARDAVTNKDARRFEARRLENLPAAERRLFNDAPRVLVGNEEAESYNGRRNLKAQANLRPSTVVKEITPLMNPYTKTPLWRRAKVVLTSHVQGATAGDLGKVASLNLDDSGQVAGVSVRLEESGEVVEVPKSATDGFPLAAAFTATTLPKALGLHFTRVVVELPARRRGGVGYVYAAVARAKGWSGLAFYGGEVPRPSEGGAEGAGGR